MKRLIAAALLMVSLGQALTAEETSQKPGQNDEVLLSMPKLTHGYYFAAGSKFTTIDGKDAYMPGLRGGWIANRSFILGVAGYGLASPVHIERNIENENKKYHFGYGGVEVGYTMHSDQLVHMSLQTLIGAGGVSINRHKDHDDNDNEESTFFVAEPMLYVDVNVTRHFRISLGGGYRFVSGIDDVKTGIKNTDLSGPSGELLLRFGMF